MGRAPLVAAALWLAACGGESNCTIALSGAVNRTYRCYHAVMAWVSTANQFNFTILMDAPAEFTTASDIQAALKFPGEPQETTYTESTPGAEGSVSVAGTTTVGGVSTTETWWATTRPLGSLT